MKTRKKLRLLTKLMNPLGLCVLALLLVACSDTFTDYYPAYGDAEKAGLVKGGWIPKFVPETATAIHEQHNIDTNDVWIRFDVPAADRDRMAAGLRRVEEKDMGDVTFRRPAAADWWFGGLSPRLWVSDRTLKVEVYAAEDGRGRTGYVAFDRNGPHVYYWCAPG